MSIDYSKMKAPGDTRPTWRNGILQIHITRACDLNCVACTQGSNLAGKITYITLENFEKAVESVKDYYGVIGIFGGNPVLHPKFSSICEILAKHIPFEQRGLWSNNLLSHGELCSRIFNPKVSNLNLHGKQELLIKFKETWPSSQPFGFEDSRHSPPFVAMKDLIDLPKEQQERLIESCDINQLWSAMICQFRGELRGYFCEIAGAQSMLHEHEEDYPDTGRTIYPGWWKQGIGHFENQINKHCFECGIPLRGIGDLSQGSNEYVSQTHASIYKLKNPKSKTLHLVSKLSDLKGTVKRATDYIANGGIMSALEGVKILIAVPTQEMARRADFYDYVNMLEKPNGTVMTFAHGQSPGRNRNLAIEQAIAQNCTHVFFIDDDCYLRPDSLMRLLKHDVDMVSGLYMMRNYPHLPLIFDYTDEKGRCRHDWLTDGKSGLIEVVATGLGATLIKIEVFKTMVEKELVKRGAENEPRWVNLGELEPDHWCDDIGFFHRARAAGFKLHCDLDCVVGHAASAIVWPHNVNGKWHVVYDTSGKGQVQFPVFIPQEILDREKDEEAVVV